MREAVRLAEQADTRPEEHHQKTMPRLRPGTDEWEEDDDDDDKGKGGGQDEREKKPLLMTEEEEKELEELMGED